ncbi:MAG: (2Fe-2S)-binding protein [Myxococcales bacterium]|nr:(2Fe-2S)-binding protein [Myxococcales bacterium]
MSQRLSPLTAPITLDLDGETIPAREGEPVAASLIAAGELLFSRSPKYHRPRGPFCLSGACSHCLMRVDGVPNVPTCRVPARAGMHLERQNALPDARVDLLRAADFVFRSWFNHHEFLAGVPIAEDVLQRVARKLSGLGVLPEKPAPGRAPAVKEEHEVVIAGAGAAGLAAAKRLAERGVTHTLFEREREVGGRLLLGLDPDAPAVWQPASDRLRAGALVVGLFADEARPFLVTVEKDRVHVIFYRALILALGGQPFLPTFPNNDLPGVMADRAVAALIRRHEVLPGKTIACVGDPAAAEALSSVVRKAGGHPVAVGAEPLRAHGLRQVDAVTVRTGDREEKVRCDVIAVCGCTAPSFELARAGGAKVAWEPRAKTFVVEADGQGRTANASLFVAGELTGPKSAGQAAASGVAAAEAIAGGAR